MCFVRVVCTVTGTSPYLPPSRVTGRQEPNPQRREWGLSGANGAGKNIGRGKTKEDKREKTPKEPENSCVRWGQVVVDLEWGGGGRGKDLESCWSSTSV